jgi:hypothetical protein
VRLKTKPSHPLKLQMNLAAFERMEVLAIRIIDFAQGFGSVHKKFFGKSL